MSQHPDEQLAKVTIETPTDRDALAFNALDRHSREMARETWVRVDGKILPCMSFKVAPNGNLILEVMRDHFEIVRK
jgi:hypothetical protein